MMVLYSLSIRLGDQWFQMQTFSRDLAQAWLMQMVEKLAASVNGTMVHEMHVEYSTRLFQ